MRQQPSNSPSIFISLAIFAWNEEKVIARTLSSLFEQSLFAELGKRGLSCEVMCVLNGCTDRTSAVAREFFQAHLQKDSGPARCDVIELKQRGKLNAWNEFVYRLSAPEAHYLVMMDSDILLRGENTLWNMVSLLSSDPEASVAVDQPVKDIALKSSHRLRDRLSLRAAAITRSAEAQLCAQLYCIRAELARKIYLPKDLPACEDGFIKALVCTDFITHDPNPSRIQRAPDAEHSFEAYTSPGAILRNQKRQVLGQTVIHLLIESYLKQMPPAARERSAELLRDKDGEDPSWLLKLISTHLAKTRFFWRLCPTYVGTSFRRWRKLPPTQRITTFPAAMATTLLSIAGSFLAHRALKQGCTDYWPKEKRSAGSSDAELWRANAIENTHT